MRARASRLSANWLNLDTALTPPRQSLDATNSVVLRGTSEFRWLAAHRWAETNVRPETNSHARSHSSRFSPLLTPHRAGPPLRVVDARRDEDDPDPSPSPIKKHAESKGEHPHQHQARSIKRPAAGPARKRKIGSASGATTPWGYKITFGYRITSPSLA